jgi:hypothetical protein
MTPQEKATELLTKYRRHLPVNTATDLEAKVCALIAVEEIIKSNPIFPISFNPHPTKRGAEQYWEEVKQEIEKL